MIDERDGGASEAAAGGGAVAAAPAAVGPLQAPGRGGRHQEAAGRIPGIGGLHGRLLV